MCLIPKCQYTVDCQVFSPEPECQGCLDDLYGLVIVLQGTQICVKRYIAFTRLAENYSFYLTFVAKAIKNEDALQNMTEIITPALCSSIVSLSFGQSSVFCNQGPWG